MSVTRFAVAAATLSMLAGSAFAAPSFEGAWKGKIKVNMAKLPPATSPQMQQMMQQQLAAVAKATLELSLNKGGTFVINVTGSPEGAPKPKPQTGTWSVKGDQLTLTSPKDKANPKSFKISKDHKSFSLDLQNGAAMMVFTR